MGRQRSDDADPGRVRRSHFGSDSFGIDIVQASLAGGRSVSSPPLSLSPSLGKQTGGSHCQDRSGHSGVNVRAAAVCHYNWRTLPHQEDNECFFVVFFFLSAPDCLLKEFSLKHVGQVLSSLFS